MNLWRVELDEASGKTLGSPTIVTTGATASHQHLDFSADGRSLAYVESIVAAHLWKVPLDPSAGKVTDTPSPISDSRLASRVDVSPDGQELVFHDSGSGRENIFIISAGGQGRRQLIDDPHKNLVPRWSPDGKKISFYSNRSGAWDLWTIEPDGSGLHQLTDTPDQTFTFTAWSPDGSRMAYFSNTHGGGYIFDPNRPWGEQSPMALPSWAGEEESLQFQPYSWSPDGRSIAGAVLNETGRHRPAIYDLESETHIDSSKVLASLTSNRTEFPSWLPDSSGLIVVGRDTASGTRGIFFHGQRVSRSPRDSSEPGRDVAASVPRWPMDLFQPRHLRGRRLAPHVQRTLDRKVTLKVLPPELAESEERPSSPRAKNVLGRTPGWRVCRGTCTVTDRRPKNRVCTSPSATTPRPGTPGPGAPKETTQHSRRRPGRSTGRTPRSRTRMASHRRVPLGAISRWTRKPRRLSQLVSAARIRTGIPSIPARPSQAMKPSSRSLDQA